MIYLDNAASTPVLDSVKAKLINTLDIYGNPSSLHDEGIKAKKIIYEAQDIISKKIKCNPAELYFTSGATMSNCVILQGFQGDVISSAIEHEDILLMNPSTISVDSEGFLNLNQLKLCLSELPSPTLVSVQMANSVFGTIQNIKRISEIVHSYGGFLHTDATQYIPHYPIDVKEMGIDALSMSGQKIGCIKGIGLLYVSEILLPHITPIILGKQGLIGGTENVLGIACLGEAFKELHYNKEETQLRDMLIQGLNGELIGSLYKRLPNNVCVKFNEVNAIDLVQLLNEYGICCSAGSACSSGDSEPSSALIAIGLSRDDANSCVRFTLGKNITEQDILATIRIVDSVVEILKE